ncbi:hypothetical protein F5Y10DRAFT_281735 [Nemania abortiva]|nr:hypothetical protein F5Y10DRAFT_281735 [Nemania abortiva]
MAPSLADLRRRSCVSPSLSSSSSERQTHHRQYSLPSLQGTTRTSLAPPATLMTIPSNPSEWRNAISEVKRKYLARKYRSCSMQCCEILDNVKDTSVIEPLHLIYLHFYAASSFEWCARPLSSSSAYRTKLLSSAQTHYAEAEALIAAAEWNAAERVRSPSPGLSTSSRTSDESSAPPSPRTSVFSIDDEPSTKRAPRTRVKPKKKVSFSGLPEFFEFQPEPYIRPDSPTLGWDDYALGPQHDVYTSCPISPRTASPTSIIKLPLEERKQPTENVAPTDQGQNQERSSTPTSHAFDLDSFLQTRTLNRFRTQLSALREQVSRHRTAVDGLLATPENTPVPAMLPSEPNVVPTARPLTHDSSTPNTPTSIMSPLSATGGEGNLRDRIERLRASGWRRKRFDNRRYEALREQVLGELAACG